MWTRKIKRILQNKGIQKLIHMCVYVNNYISTHTHTYTEKFCSRSLKKLVVLCTRMWTRKIKQILQNKGIQKLIHMCAYVNNYISTHTHTYIHREVLQLESKETGGPVYQNVDKKDQANPSKSAEQRHSKTDPRVCMLIITSLHTHTYTEKFCSWSLKRLVVLCTRMWTRSDDDHN